MLAAAAIAVAGVAVVLLLRQPVTPEELIRQRVIQMVHAAEERDLGFLMAQVAPGFRSAEGWNRDQLRTFLAAQLAGDRWLRIFPVRMETRLAGPDLVDVQGVFLLGRSRAADLKELARSSEVQGERIDARFQREPDGQWRAISAAHQPLSQEELLRTVR